MILVGTSGYNYPEWKGSFYPQDMPAAKMLPFYAERFPSVEINASFSRMPTPSSMYQGEAPRDSCMRSEGSSTTWVSHWCPPPTASARLYHAPHGLRFRRALDTGSAILADFTSLG